jgi:hypothetical protein
MGLWNYCVIQYGAEAWGRQLAGVWLRIMTL